MTKQEFAQNIKAKYPQYNDMDDEELTTLILNKYPVYRSQITEDKSLLSKIGGIGADIIRGIAKPVAKSFLAPGQAIVSAATGKTPTDLKVPFLGDVTPPQTVREGVGTALQTGLLGVGSGALKGAKLGATVAKESAIGAGFGLGIGLEEGKKGRDLVTPTLAGAALGAVAPVAVKGLSKGISKVGESLSSVVSKTNKLKPIIREKIGEAASKKLDQVSRDILKMSPTASKNEARWNKNTPKFLVDEGIITLIESDGKKLSTGEAISAIKNKFSAESNAFKSVLKDSGEYISLNKLKTNALKGTSNLKSRGTDLAKAKKQIIEEIASLKENYADVGLVQGDDILINVSDFNDIKSGFWKKTSSFSATQADKLSSDLNYQMGQIAKDMIEKSVDDTGIKAMNSRMGDFMSAIKVLENAEGKAVPGGFFGKQFTKLAGTVVGAPAGTIGAIIGNLTGGKLADLMINPQIKTVLLTKIVSKLNKTPKGRTIIEEAAEVLTKRGEARASRKLLEAATDIPLGAKADTSKILSQEEADILLKELGTVPNVKGVTPPTITDDIAKAKAEGKSFESVKAIMKKFEDSDVDSFIYESGDDITLSKVIVPKKDRGSGVGTEFMDDLIKYADENGKRILLTPTKDFGGSIARLKEFYKRFGFIENKGRTRDFSTRESMIRPSK